ncbi:MAG: zinc-ribbon domain-containing protein [Clostridia bacterium]|nr:zinc-ribbon domain-containing protein [Clostridia bacterium]
MSKFCKNCGTQINDSIRYCPNCGAALTVPDAQPAYAPAGPVYAGNGAVRQGVPAPGYSDRADHPEILAAIKKNRKAAGIFAFFLVPLPLIGSVIYGITSDKTEIGRAAMIGGVISAVFLIFALFMFIKERAKNAYEATVIDKTSRSTYRNNDSGNLITEYITVVKTSDGRKKKIVEREGSQILAYYYLDIGDRFKYHPQFHFPYERYDKSRAPYIACVSCGTKNPVEADRCGKCGLPLLK